jgi:hypothetical protein
MAVTSPLSEHDWNEAFTAAFVEARDHRDDQTMAMLLQADALHRQCLLLDRIDGHVGALRHEYERRAR